MRVLWLFAVTLVALGATAPWSKKPAQWTSADVDRILADSPWAQQAMAMFGQPLEPDDMPVTPPPGAQGNLPGNSNRGVSDGRWDGGVARNSGIGETPTLAVTVRWDSALPVREALRQAKQESGLSSRAESEYVITVLGLASAASKNPQDASDDADQPKSEPPDPAQISRAFVDNSRLILRNGKMVVSPDDVKYDAATGAIHLLFPRSTSIKLADKEVTFVTRYGSLSVRKRFRLKEMTYQGQLEL